MIPEQRTRIPPMKTLILLLTLSLTPTFTFAEAPPRAKELAREAERGYIAAVNESRSEYRKQLAKALAEGDKVEVFLLDFELDPSRSTSLFWEENLAEDEFPVLPYRTTTKILARKTLTPEQRLAFLPPLQAVVGVQGNVGSGAMCHLPIHGVRVYSVDTMIFQSSFCWKCHNFALAYPDRPSWVQIQGNDLFDAFQDILPTPQSELDRFKAKYGGENTSKPQD